MDITTEQAVKVTQYINILIGKAEKIPAEEWRKLKDIVGEFLEVDRNENTLTGRIKHGVIVPKSLDPEIRANLLDARNNYFLYEQKKPKTFTKEQAIDLTALLDLMARGPGDLPPNERDNWKEKYRELNNRVGGLLERTDDGKPTGFVKPGLMLEEIANKTEEKSVQRNLGVALGNLQREKQHQDSGGLDHFNKVSFPEMFRIMVACKAGIIRIPDRERYMEALEWTKGMLEKDTVKAYLEKQGLQTDILTNKNSALDALKKTKPSGIEDTLEKVEKLIRITLAVQKNPSERIPRLEYLRMREETKGGMENFEALMKSAGPNHSIHEVAEKYLTMRNETRRAAASKISETGGPEKVGENTKELTEKLTSLPKPPIEELRTAQELLSEKPTAESLELARRLCVLATKKIEEIAESIK